jgi:L-alanine-DL-glutamate epimerase-like enolase superfamily enzyme
MKITAIQTIALDIPFREGDSGAKYGGQVRSTVPMLLVRVNTDEGITGWGEVFAFNLREATRAALMDTVIPRCIGKDPTQIADLMLEIRRDLRNSKAGTLTFALSAIDIALWDIVGKLAGLPLYRLLGGGAKRTVPAYASLIRFGDADLAARKALETVERGYRHLKLHEIAFDPVAAVRQAVGNTISIMLDVSSAWSVQQAVVMARHLKDLGLTWLEEPTWPPEDYRALARVARESGLAIAAGENVISVADFRTMCETADISYAQPSVCKIGGITEMQKAMAIAEAFNVAVVPHAYYLGPGLLASLHLIAAWPGEILVEHAVFDIESHPYAGLIDLEHGAIPIPQSPGVGPDPDPDFLARHTRP